MLDQIDEEKIMQIAEELRTGFSWADTPQGFGYWQDVYSELYLAAGRPIEDDDEEEED